jgi:hypothetical protein
MRVGPGYIYFPENIYITGTKNRSQYVNKKNNRIVRDTFHEQVKLQV